MKGDVAISSANGSATSPGDVALFELALTHSSIGARRATSGSNSSATGCSAWSSRALLYERYPDEPEGKLSQPLQRAGRARDLRGGRPRDRHPGAGPARQAGARGRRQRQRERRRRRGRSADRRLLPRRRAWRRRERFILAAVGPTSPSQRRAPAASQVGASGTGRGQRLQAARYEVVGAHRRPARADVHRPRVGAKLGEATPRARASRKRRPRPPPRCWIQLQ